MESDGVARFLLQQNSPEHSVKNEGLRQFWIAEANIGQNVSNLGKNKIGVGVSFEGLVHCRKMTEKKIIIIKKRRRAHKVIFTFLLYVDSLFALPHHREPPSAASSQPIPTNPKQQTEKLDRPTPFSAVPIELSLAIHQPSPRNPKATNTSVSPDHRARTP